LLTLLFWILYDVRRIYQTYTHTHTHTQIKFLKNTKKQKNKKTLTNVSWSFRLSRCSRGIVYLLLFRIAKKLRFLYDEIFQCWQFGVTVQDTENHGSSRGSHMGKNNCWCAPFTSRVLSPHNFGVAHTPVSVSAITPQVLHGFLTFPAIQHDCSAVQY
jgi:hypothetical protein